MKINKVFCLFEQSGHFKKAFQELGIPAEDYDILNDFGETDHITDIFAEIDKAYQGEPSLFDEIGENDLVMAFFPCTRFENQINLAFRGQMKQQKTHSDIEKLEYVRKLHQERARLYDLICKMFIVALRGGWRMIVENPHSNEHYLVRYFPIKAKLIDCDRRKNGDAMKKPTQYWFINCEPENNIFFEVMDYVKPTIEYDLNQVQRSLIHPQYCRRFIKQYLLDRGQI